MNLTSAVRYDRQHTGLFKRTGAILKTGTKNIITNHTSGRKETTKVKKKKLLEAAIVTIIAGGLFLLTRKAGIAYRGNTLWGGEICVAPLVFLLWYGGKSIVKDIKSGLFTVTEADYDD